MATMTSKRIIRTMLEAEGVYPGDPPCSSIWSYTNPACAKGLQAHYAVYYLPGMSPEGSYVQDAVLLLEDGKLTEAGTDELGRLQGMTEEEIRSRDMA